MFEDQTYEVILQRMLNEIDDSLDKREGSIIYNALASTAAELAQSYIELENVLSLGFADTSNDQWLAKRTAEVGVPRNKASKATRRATFNISVALNKRFFVDSIYFKVIEAGANAVLECETAGNIGNVPIIGSKLIPVDSIDGLTSAVLGEIVIAGEDDESDDSLFLRYATRLKEPSTTYNKAQIKEFAETVTGVGQARVFPDFDGQNTCKVVIVDSTFSPASPELIEDVQNYLDPSSTGLGEGVAGIGVKIEVASAVTKPINITVNGVVLISGANTTQAINEIKAGLETYFKSLFSSNVLQIKFNEIGSIIYNSPSVFDYSNLLVNGASSNILITETDAPVVGTVTLNV